ncbi:MAG: FmdE family protein [Thermoleophilia bacterium]|nr:FmdE family protein [Thermoleophilia bacterium]
MRPLEEDLQAARAFHGHLCHGMVMGVRMARYACRALGIEDPLSHRDLVVYVEMDRCASDAISVVAGVTLGRRRLKWVDYGKMAATFVDLATGRAVRAAARPEVPHATREHDPLEYWKNWTDEELFTLTPVRMDIPEADRPGARIPSVHCQSCGELVRDGRAVTQNGKTLCKACAFGAYYQPL